MSDVLRLDDLYGPPLVMEWQGREHRIPGDAFTMDVVQRIMRAMHDGAGVADIDDEMESARAGVEMLDEVRGLVEQVLAQAKPKLILGELPPSAVMVIAGKIVEHGYGGGDGDPPPNRPNRAARRQGTRQTRK